MCRHYHTLQDATRFIRYFGAEPQSTAPNQTDVWPGYFGQFIRRSPKRQENNCKVEALSGMFGLLPDWSNECSIALTTFNARSETVCNQSTFKSAWLNAQHCIIPVEALFVMFSRGRRQIPTRITSNDGSPMGLAGLWACRETPSGPL